MSSAREVSQLIDRAAEAVARDVINELHETLGGSWDDLLPAARQSLIAVGRRAILREFSLEVRE